MDMSSAQRLEKIKTHVGFREMGGAWLKKKRLQAVNAEGNPLTQLEVAEAIGIASAGYISAIESGGPSVPEDRWDDYAEVLSINRDLFRRNMVMFYLPRTYEAFAGKPTKKQLEEGLTE